MKHRTIIITAIILLFTIQTVAADVYYVPYLHQAKIVDHPEFKPVGILDVDTFTGAASYNYELKLPKGTNDLTPQVTLSYNSHLTYQRPSIVGTGWVLSSYDYIQRNTNHTFNETSDDYYDLYFEGRHYELVYVADEERYHTKEESFFFIQKLSGASNENGEYWVLKTKDGTEYRFGYNTDAEMIATEYSYTWRWSLDQVTDSYDNTIDYAYQENPDADDSSAVYPYTITYNRDESRVITFELEDREDIWTGYYDGSYVVESQRIAEIEITVNSALVRKYVIDYEELGINTRYSISSIQEYGSDGTTTLPATTFTYEEMQWSFDESPSFEDIPEDAAFTNTDGTEEYGVRFGDFNGDGLLDLIKSLETCTDDDWCFGAWLNTGSGWEESSSFTPDESQAFIDTFDNSDLGVRVFDVNCDGLDDLVKNVDCATDACQEVWLSTGNGFREDETYELSQDAAFVDEDGVNYGTEVADLNGDGNVDILRSSPDAEGAWINTCSGWSENSQWIVSTQTDGTYDEALFVDSDELDNCVRTVDLNGDHLSDLLRFTDEEALAWVNTGSGWKEVTEEGLWIPESTNLDVGEIGFCDDTTKQDTGSRITDLTGDGLIDIVKDESSREIFFNTGQYWDEDTEFDFPDVVFAEDGENYGTRIADVNGDGHADVLQAKGTTATGEYNIMLNKNQQVYLLTSITNDMGGVQEITYTSSIEADNTGEDDKEDLNFNMWLIETKTDNSGQTEATTAYTYDGGYYDKEDEEFRGFYYVIEDVDDALQIDHYYYQDVIRKGKEEMIMIYDSSERLYQKIEYQWEYTEQDDYAIIFLDQQTKTLFNPDDETDYKATTTSYTYDAYGNIEGILYTGDDEEEGDERSEEWEYVVNEDVWIIDKPMRYTQYNAEGNRIAETYFSYDTYAYGDAPTAGDVTKQEMWLEDGENPSTQYSYDAYGNVIEIIDPNEGVTTYEYGTTETTYTHPDAMTNAVGHRTTYSYDLGTGNIETITDANTVETTYTYDLFGRVTGEVYAYDTETYPAVVYEYSHDGSFPESILIKQRKTHGEAETFDTYYFYDGFGNLIEVKEEAEESQQRITTIVYDGLARVEQITNPYFTSASETYTGETTYTTTYVYDPLNNVVQIKNPDETTKEITFSVWDITVTDENSHKKEYALDAYGQIIEVTEYIDDVPYTTTYVYTSVGNLEEIKDAEENTFAYSYDTLGRKIAMSDPDVGSWSYKYDANGNLIEQTDARGIVTTFTYDDINRILSKSTDTQSVVYLYDEEYQGTVSTITTNDLLTSYTYDDLLRVLTETMGIGDYALTTTYEYDAMNRVTTVSYPDGTKQSYEYNTGNLLETITMDEQEIMSIGYSAAKLPETRTYANGQETTLVYDEATLRLEQIATNDIQDLTYQYDNIGNIVGISDIINNKEKEISYDALDRMTSVSVVKGGVEDSSFSYVYNTLGNVLSTETLDSSGTFSYDTFPVHAPSFSLLPEESESSAANTAPTQDTPVLTSSLGTDTTDEDLTVTAVNTNDVDGDDIRNIIAWIKDGIPYQTLHMPFDTPGIVDYSGNENAVTTTATYSEDRNGFGEYTFTGTEEIIVTDDDTISMSFRPNDVIVVSAWIKTTESGPIFIKKREYGLLMTNAGNFVFNSWSDTSGRIGSGYNDGNWHHVVAVFKEGESYSIYVDGALIGEKTTTDTSLNTASNLEIGGYSSSTRSSYFVGEIDDVLLFKRDVSDEQIQALYESYNTGNPFETIVAEETTSGETWSAIVTPTDGTDDGEAKESNEITIV